MILIPSIELREGAVVAWPADADGESRPEVLADDPIALARQLRDEGALFFHLVDGDALLGGEQQLELVGRFVDAGLPCEVAGGITEVRHIDRLLEVGADRVVADPALLADGDGAREVVERLGARLAVGLDVAGEAVRTIARRPEATVPLDEVLALIGEAGVRRVVHRSADANDGPEVAPLRVLLERLQVETFAIAKVRSKADLEALTALGDVGLAGIVLEEAARALLERA